MTPTVSVIIPTYNRCSYVQQAIDSVLAQTHTDYEIIVIDDGSTDGTGEALRERYGDRITYEWQENQGESVARNRGIALAQGEYIAFLDSDDLWLPEKLEKQVAYLEEHPDAGAVFAEAWIIDGLGQRVSDRRASTGITLDDLSLEGLCFEDCLLLPSTVVLRKALVAAAGGFDVEIHHGEDYEYFARVRLLGSFAHLAEPLACHRRHGDNQSYLSSEGSQAQLDTHLLAVSRVFDGWRESPEGLRDRVVAWNYARSAMVQGALGHSEELLSLLTDAVATDAGVLGEYERLAREAARNSGIVYESGGNVSGDLALNYVRQLLDSLSAVGSQDRHLVERLSAMSYASIGFAAHGRGDLQTVRRTLPRAVMLDRTLLRNAGVWSILFEAAFGLRLSRCRRAVFSGCRTVAFSVRSLLPQTKGRYEPS